MHIDGSGIYYLSRHLHSYFKYEVLSVPLLCSLGELGTGRKPDSRYMYVMLLPTLSPFSEIAQTA